MAEKLTGLFHCMWGKETIPQEFKDYTDTQAGNSIKRCESLASYFGNGFAKKKIKIKIKMV